MINIQRSFLKWVRKNYFSALYLFIGLSSLYFFTWTGKYLRTTYPDKQSLETGFRVMLRSRHIFILLMSLIELGIGAYIRQGIKTFYLSIQWLATITLFTAHVLFIYAFFQEVEIIHIPKTPILHYATYGVLAGVALHALTRFESRFE